MKKIIVTFILTFMFLVTGCGFKGASHKEVMGEGINFEKIKEELKQVPKELTVEDALSKGYFVVKHGVVKSEMNILENFIKASEEGQPVEIYITQFTMEGDTIVTKLNYDGDLYYGVEDNSRHKFNDREIIEFSFKYLKKFEEKDMVFYYLINDEDVTYNKLMKSMLSNYSVDFIKHKYIVRYYVK